MFQTSLTRALPEKLEVLSNKKDDQGIYWNVKGSQDMVTVTNNPSCTCPYFVSKHNNTVQICKHLIWVYVKFISVSTG